jgi:ornithine cyclodeaminase/alanine dehydrogenase-like protein (mu-crystallin family)
MSQLLELKIEPVTSAEEALRDADVVDLCAPGHFDVREPLFEPGWVKSGALVISMAHNQYSPSFAERAMLVTSGSDHKPGATPLGAVIAGRAQPRAIQGDRVIYALEGGTAQDLFVASWAYEWARARGLGLPFDLSA